MAHEYKVIPAPRRGKRGKATKGPAGRFAYAVESTLNEMAADGWEFVRAETLGADEREGVMRRKVETFHGVLVFRREIVNAPPPRTSVADVPLATPPKQPEPKTAPKLTLTEAAVPLKPANEKPRIQRVAAAETKTTQVDPDDPAER